MGIRVAIVEDDLTLRGHVVRGLEDQGFDIALACSEGGALLAFDEPVDVVVLDVGLPDADGRDVALALRSDGNDVPVLMLTARGALDDRLSGFHAGADDYLVKPFAFDELVVRLLALAKRGHSDIPESKELHVDQRNYRLVCGDQSVDISPNELRLLGTLFKTPGEVVRRRVLVSTVWGGGGYVSENSLDVHIARIRRKLAEVGRPDALQTVRGVGYRVNV